MATVVATSPKILKLTVEEASGKNRSDNYVWDQEVFEGFVKAEVRGGTKTVKASTDRAPVKDGQITWQQDLHLEVQEGATELRLLLCREKTSNGKKGISVVTACGIFVKDILEAVPIDKYFEMFKPVTGMEGGYIRLRMRLVNPNDVTTRDIPGSVPTKKKRGLLGKLLLLGGLVAAVYLAKKRQI